MNAREAYQKARWLDQHRADAYITCDEGCECWDVEAQLLQHEQDGGRIIGSYNYGGKNE